MISQINMEKLWNDIRLIYEGLNFSGSLLIDNLMIMSQDNHYLLYYKQDDTITQIRIEKDYNLVRILGDLVRIWGGDVPYDMVSYKLYVEKDGKVELDENYKIDMVYKIITPFLRECKLSEILIDKITNE